MADSNATPRRAMVKKVALATGAVSVVAAGFVAGKLFDHRGEERELLLAADIPGFFWPNPPGLPEFALVDHNGAALTRENLKGRWSMLYFGYTSCPDACPIALSVLAQVEKELATHATFGDKFQGVFISVDPSRDRDKLAAYVEHFSKRFIGATAEDKGLMGITRPLGILYLRHPADSAGEYLVDHSNSLLLIDPQARLVGLFNGPHDAKFIAEQLRKIHDIVV